MFSGNNNNRQSSLAIGSGSNVQAKKKPRGSRKDKKKALEAIQNAVEKSIKLKREYRYERNSKTKQKKYLSSLMKIKRLLSRFSRKYDLTSDERGDLEKILRMTVIKLQEPTVLSAMVDAKFLYYSINHDNTGYANPFICRILDIDFYACTDRSRIGRRTLDEDKGMIEIILNTIGTYAKYGFGIRDLIRLWEHVGSFAYNTFIHLMNSEYINLFDLNEVSYKDVTVLSRLAYLSPMNHDAFLLFKRLIESDYVDLNKECHTNSNGPSKHGVLVLNAILNSFVHCRGATHDEFSRFRYAIKDVIDLTLNKMKINDKEYLAKLFDCLLTDDVNIGYILGHRIDLIEKVRVANDFSFTTIQKESVCLDIAKLNIGDGVLLRRCMEEFPETLNHRDKNGDTLIIYLLSHLDSINGGIKYICDTINDVYISRVESWLNNERIHINVKNNEKQNAASLLYSYFINRIGASSHPTYYKSAIRLYKALLSRKDLILEPENVEQICHLLQRIYGLKHKNGTLVREDNNISAQFNALFRHFVSLNPNAANASGQTLLMLSLSAGNNAFVNTVLDNKETNINLRDKNGATALNYALECNASSGLILGLIMQGADVNATPNNGSPPLVNAIKNQLYDVAKFLLTQKDIDVHKPGRNGETALSCLHVQKIEKVTDLSAISELYLVLLTKPDLKLDPECCNQIFTSLNTIYLKLKNHNSIIETINNALKSLFNLNPGILNEHKQTLLMRSLEAKNEVFADILLSDVRTKVDLTDDKGDTALNYAVRHHASIKMITDLLTLGAAINAMSEQGFPPLVEAIRQQSYDVARLLLKQSGINVNKRGCDGETALSLLLKQKPGDDELGVKLIESGSLVDDVDSKSGNTLLMTAIKNGHIRTAKMIVGKSQCDVNAVNSLKQTALMFTVMRKNPDFLFIKELLAAGANINQEDTIGLTAKLYAARFGHKDLVVLFNDQEIKQQNAQYLPPLNPEGVDKEPERIVYERPPKFNPAFFEPPRQQADQDQDMQQVPASAPLKLS